MEAVEIGQLDSTLAYTFRYAIMQLCTVVLICIRQSCMLGNKVARDSCEYASWDLNDHPRSLLSRFTTLLSNASLGARNLGPMPQSLFYPLKLQISTPSGVAVSDPAIPPG